MVLECKDESMAKFIERTAPLVKELHRDSLLTLRGNINQNKKNVLELIKKLANGNEEIENACLHTFIFCNEYFSVIPSKKYHKRKEVLSKFAEVQHRCPDKTKQANIDLTALELKMTSRAVKKHIYGE